MIAYVFQPVRAGQKARLWSARVRLDGWAKPRYFALHVTDKRVAKEKLRALVIDLEREMHGVGIPASTREAMRVPLNEHHKTFVAACEAAKLSKNTINKYRHSLPKLFERCRWTSIREITAQSFTDWRESSGLRPKTVNDLLGSMRTMLRWMKRRRLLAVDPLADVRKVANPNVGSFRRSLSVDETQRLLSKSPHRRAVVYQTIVYTGLRRAEMNGLKWDDFKLEEANPYVRVPSSLSKNRKEAILYLRPELVKTLKEFRPPDAKPEDFVFCGLLPRIPTLKRDLVTAGIPFEDARGRRIDLHSLRKTYGTMLAAAGVSPRVAMELMRHSDMKLTMGVYTDVAQLPVIAESARLPSLTVATPAPSAPPAASEKALSTHAKKRNSSPVSVHVDVAGDALGGAQTGVSAGREQSRPVAKPPTLSIHNYV